MNRNDLAKALAKKANLSLDNAEKLIVSFGDTICEVLQKKEKVIYSNFGTFYTVHYPSKVIYHPVLGKKKQMVMLPTDAVKWMPSGNIKELVQTSQEVESATAFGATKKHKEENRKAGILEIKAKELTDEEIIAVVNYKQQEEKQQAPEEEEEFVIPIRVTRSVAPAEADVLLGDDSVNIPINVSGFDIPLLDFDSIDANSIQRIGGQDKIIDSESLDKLLIDFTQSSKKDIAYVDLDSLDLPESLTSILSKEMINKYHVLPIGDDEEQVILAMNHPDDRASLEMIEHILGKKVSPRLSSKGEIEKYLKKFQLPKDVVLPEIKISENGLQDSEFLTLSGSNSPMTRLVNLIITRAVREKATEIHFEPQNGQLIMKYRTDHVLKIVTTFPSDIARAITTQIKIFSQMNIETSHLPQTGYFKQKYSGYTLRFYISTLPVSEGEKIVIKITNKSLPLMKLESLGLLGNDLRSATTACQKLHGLIMLSGPKNSGKSTTFYSVLNETYFDGINITSLEDPIECTLKNINQSEIDETSGYTLEMAIDSVLKQDPDVLAVSESATKKITGKLIKSATKGRLVVSTMAAESLDETVSNLLSTGIDPTVVFSSINLLVNQRLVKKLCEHCKEQIELTENEKKIIKSEIDKMPAVEKELLRKGGLKFYQGKGCNRCHHRGYRGEIGIFELLKMPANVKKELLSKLDGPKINKFIYDNTMSLVQDGILKASLGMTTIEEILEIRNKQ